MITKIFPKDFQRYLSLPMLGTIYGLVCSVAAGSSLHVAFDAV